MKTAIYDGKNSTCFLPPLSLSQNFFLCYPYVKGKVKEENYDDCD